MKPWLILLIVFAILIAIYVISGLIVRALLKNAKRKAIIEQLSNYAEDKETKDLFAKLTNSELESIYKALLK